MASDRSKNSICPKGMDGDATIDQAGELRSARVESLRAIAALGVLVGHVFALTHYYNLERIGVFIHRALLGGLAGVDLFFVLSGYLLFWPFAQRYLGRGDSIDLRRYATNRALRILPLYYVVLVMLLVFREQGGTLKQWVTFVSFSQNFFTDTLAKVDPVMWSLVVELHFYILLPLLAPLLARVAGRSRGRAAVVLGALGLMSFVFRLFVVELDPTPDFLWRFWRCSLFANFLFFVAGMLLALVRLSWEERPPGWLRSPLASADMWIFVSGVFWAVVFGLQLKPMAAISGFFVVGACVLPLQPGPLVRSLEWAPLALIGVASYSLYLWHPPILLALDRARWAPSDFLGLLAIGLPLSCLVALASYALIEAPFLRLRRQWARSTLRRSGTAAKNQDTSADRATVWSVVGGLRTTVLTAAVMVGLLAVGVLLGSLKPDPSNQPDKAKTGKISEGKVLSPADGKATASESPLPATEDDR